MTQDHSATLSQVESEVSRLLNLHEGPGALANVVALGGAAIPALEHLLRGPSQAVYHPRCWAADALAAIGGSQAIQALVRALDDSVRREPPALTREAEDVVVSCIAEHLAGAPEAHATAALIDALGRRAYPGCVRALGRLRAWRALPLLIRSLFEDATREPAAEALRQLGAVCIPPVARAVQDVRRASKIEPPTHIDGRAAAAVLLGTLLQQNPAILETVRQRALTRLRHGLHDAQRRVRVSAALSLIRCEDSVPTAIRVLVRALDEPDRRRLTPILRTLTRLGPRIEPALFEILASDESSERAARRRRHAVWLAGQLGTAAASEALSRVRAPQDTALRLGVIAALDHHGATQPATLEHYLEDTDVGVRRRAVRALRQRESLSFPRAVILLGDRDHDIRYQAMQCLSQDPVAARHAVHRALLCLGAPARGLRPRLRLLYYGVMWRWREALRRTDRRHP